MAFFFIIMATFCVLKYHNMWADMYDMGQEIQVHWNTAFGRWFESSVEVSNNLGDHTTFINIVTAAVYRIAPRPETLLVWQAFIFTLGAIPAYRIARFYRPENNQAWFAWVVAVIYLAQPAAGYAIGYEYHPLVYAPLFALWCFDAVIRQRFAWAWLAFACLLLTREDCGPLACAIGVLVAMTTAHKRTGLAFFFTGLAAFLIISLVVLPYFRGAPSDTLARYAHLGETPGQIIATLLFKPHQIIALLFDDPRRLTFIPILMLPWLFTNGRILAFWPAILLVTLPGILSDNPCQYTLGWHYPLTAIPVLTIGATLGAARLIEAQPARQRWLDRRALIACTTIVITLAVMNLNGVLITQRYFMTHNPLRAEFLQITKNIPDDAAVSATGKLGAQLAQRRQIAIYPITTWPEDAFPKLAQRQATHVLIQLTDPLLLPEDRLPDSAQYELAASTESLRLYKQRTDKVAHASDHHTQTNKDVTDNHQITQADSH